MLSIIGFEGGRQENHVLTFGAACISDGVSFFNGGSRRAPIDEWASLVQLGHVTNLGYGRGPLPGAFTFLPAYVLRTLREDKHPVGFYIDQAIRDDRDRVQLRWKDTLYSYYLFGTLECLNEFTERIKGDMEINARDFNTALNTLTAGLVKP